MWRKTHQHTSAEVKYVKLFENKKLQILYRHHALFKKMHISLSYVDRSFIKNESLNHTDAGYTKYVCYLPDHVKKKLNLSLFIKSCAEKQSKNLVMEQCMSRDVNTYF